MRQLTSIGFSLAESNEEPLKVDLTSSSKGVYVRENIKQIKTIDEDTQEEIIKYQYEEAFLTHEQYQDYVRMQYLIEQVETKRENEIIDEYTLELMNTGVI